jgi:hypothetical protein|tara:strand:+ start:4649 stop:4897 length:249 start_codon:yes stop_codon:yes gene_type:complete
MNKQVIEKVIKREITRMWVVEKNLKKLLSVETDGVPEERLDGLFTRISQHLDTIASAQDKIILLQAMAEECGINVTDEKQGK